MKRHRKDVSYKKYMTINERALSIYVNIYMALNCNLSSHSFLYNYSIYYYYYFIGLHYIPYILDILCVYELCSSHYTWC